jgi:hypothetical protein
LSGRVFYGVIVAGVLLGAAAALASGWAHLSPDAAEPDRPRVGPGWIGVFVLAVCGMVGATFGGLLGLAAAVLLDRRAGEPGA